MQTLSNLTSRLMIEESRLQSGDTNSNGALLAKKAGSNKKKNNQQQKGKCFRCGSSGHYKRDCKKVLNASTSKSNETERKGDKAFIGEQMESTQADEAWHYDSGATNHMSRQLSWFYDYVELSEPRHIKIGNGDVMHAVGQGNIDILSYNGTEWIKKRMVNAWYVPQIYTNLFSASKVLDNGHTAQSTNTKVEIFDGNDVVAVGVRRGGLYRMLFKVIEPNQDASANLAMGRTTLQLWHERLGHQNVKHVREFLRKRDIEFIDEDFDCDGCAYGKMHRLSFEL